MLFLASDNSPARKQTPGARSDFKAGPTEIAHALLAVTEASTCARYPIVNIRPNRMRYETWGWIGRLKRESLVGTSPTERVSLLTWLREASLAMRLELPQDASPETVRTPAALMSSTDGGRSLPNVLNRWAQHTSRRERARGGGESSEANENSEVELTTGKFGPLNQRASASEIPSREVQGNTQTEICAAMTRGCPASLLDPPGCYVTRSSPKILRLRLLPCSQS